MKNIFVTTTKRKARFATEIGAITTEDLWDLPLESTNGPSLDKVAQGISESILKSNTKSFVKTNKKDTLLEAMLDVVKYIIDYRLQEKEEREESKINKERKDLLIDTIAEKEIDKLKERSLRSLQKEAQSL